MTFYLFFLIYVAAGILICGLLFYWAVQTGQFRDQDRARYFPLSGQAPQARDAAGAKWPRSMVVTVSMILGALICQIVVVMIMALRG